MCVCMRACVVCVCVCLCKCVCVILFLFLSFYLFLFFCANSKAISQVSGTDSESDTDLESTMHVQAYCQPLFFFFSLFLFIFQRKMYVQAYCRSLEKELTDFKMKCCTTENELASVRELDRQHSLKISEQELSFTSTRRFYSTRFTCFTSTKVQILTRERVVLLNSFYLLY